MESCDLLIPHTTALLPDMTLRNDIAIVVAASHRHAGNWQAGGHHPGGCHSTAVLGAAPATDATERTHKSAPTGRTLVMSAGAHDVSDVIVDGVVLMRERRLTQIDEAEIICKAGEHLQAITRRAGIA